VSLLGIIVEWKVEAPGQKQGCCAMVLSDGPWHVCDVTLSACVPEKSTVDARGAEWRREDVMVVLRSQVVCCFMEVCCARGN
jgi:hypothetical protein